MKKLIITALSSAISLTALNANADTGPSILQLGGAEARASEGAAVNCGHEGRVYICKAAATETQELVLEDGPRVVERIIVKEKRIIIRRPLLRALRTQGIYSGDVYPSRRFTQGFYSNRIARSR